MNADMSIKEAEQEWATLWKKQKQWLDPSVKQEISKESYSTQIRYWICLATPQSYGAQIENLFRKRWGYQKVKPRERRGDLLRDGKYYEFKCTVITPTNNSVNIVQIRPHRKIDGYIVYVINTLLGDHWEASIFRLTHEQMVHIGRQNIAHGSVEEEILNPEYRHSFSWDGPEAQTWKDSYLIGKDYI